MLVNGNECAITIITSHWEKDIPYSDETLREAVTLLQEEAPIEGSGICRGIRKSGGVTGCVVTPLSIGTAPLLLYLAFGNAALPLFVSETRSVYQYRLDLLPLEDTEQFSLIQDRGGERRLFEGCRVRGFELRSMREDAIQLKLDICGERSPAVYPYADVFERESGERFNGGCVTCRINGREYKNIYGLTLSVKKEGGTKTELWIKRIIETGADIPENIEEMSITAQLQRDNYEFRRFGMFRITLKRLVLVSDETAVDCADAVTGPLRYYAAGIVAGEVFNATGALIA